MLFSYGCAFVFTFDAAYAFPFVAAVTADFPVADTVVYVGEGDVRWYMAFVFAVEAWQRKCRVARSGYGTRHGLGWGERREETAG